MGEIEETRVKVENVAIHCESKENVELKRGNMFLDLQGNLQDSDQQHYN